MKTAIIYVAVALALNGCFDLAVRVVGAAYNMGLEDGQCK